MYLFALFYTMHEKFHNYNTNFTANTKHTKLKISFRFFLSLDYTPQRKYNRKNCIQKLVQLIIFCLCLQFLSAIYLTHSKIHPGGMLWGFYHYAQSCSRTTI